MWRIIDRFGTQVPNRRDTEPMIRAIMRDPNVDLPEVLSWLKREQLKQICEMFRLEARGREKEGYVERIVEHIHAGANSDDEAASDEGADADEVEPPRVAVPATKSGADVRARTVDEEFDVFIVHGHDDAMRLEIKRFLDDLELTSVVLQDAPDKGNTILEKLESYASQAKHAIILLSPDDEGYSRRDGQAKAKARARQNVVLELGLMIGKLGRSHVTVLHQGNVELPSDILGLIYVEYDARHKDAALLRLAKQLRHAGFKIDLNRVI